MSDTMIQVELVSADRVVWSGEGSTVIARTTEGDVGILANHAPMLAVIVEGIVEVRTADNDSWVAFVDHGFLSVAGNRVSILSEHAQMADEIDVEAAKAELEEARSADSDDESAPAAVRRAEAKIRAAERAS